MKKILTIIVLNFCLLLNAKADNIKDFQIKGMSVGDSLLDFFSETEIKKFVNYDDSPSDMRYRISETSSGKSKKFNIYDGVQFFFKPNDRNYTLHYIGGARFCSHNECLNLKKNVLQDLKSTFKNVKPSNQSFNHPDDKSGKSTLEQSSFRVSDGVISVTYYNWSKESGYLKHVRVTVATDDSIKWTQNNYGAK